MAFLRAPQARPPWILAGVLAVVAVVLTVLLFVVVYPARDDHKDSSDASAFNSTEQAAVSAATTQTINMLTYSRKSFDADFARALAGASGQLKSDLQKDKANTLKQLTTNKFDIKAQITDTALESGSASKGYLVLLVANGYRVDDAGTSSAAIPKRIELTMVKVGGKWLASDPQGIDLS
jgi:Mce-associated membrane protein